MPVTLDMCLAIVAPDSNAVQLGMRSHPHNNNTPHPLLSSRLPTERGHGQVSPFSFGIYPTQIPSFLPFAQGWGVCIEEGEGGGVPNKAGTSLTSSTILQASDCSMLMKPESLERWVKAWLGRLNMSGADDLTVRALLRLHPGSGQACPIYNYAPPPPPHQSPTPAPIQREVWSGYICGCLLALKTGLYSQDQGASPRPPPPAHTALSPASLQPLCPCSSHLPKIMNLPYVVDGGWGERNGGEGGGSLWDLRRPCPCPTTKHLSGSGLEASGGGVPSACC